MPKRTNEFQHLIAFIEREIASAGVTVTESAELEEYKDSSLREVDVLIETEVNGHPIKLAIECRDRSKPQDKEWIDGLIGKYRDLKVSQVVAVSKSGFTQGALDKSAQVGIRTLTLKEAQDADWPAEFVKPYVKFLAHQPTLKSATLIYKQNVQPELEEEQLRTAHIKTGDGDEDGTVAEVVHRLFIADASKSFIELLDGSPIGKMNELFQRGEQIYFTANIPYTVSDRFLIGPDQKRYAIETIICHVEYRLDWINADTKHFFYNRVQVTVGTLDLQGVPQKLSITAVQLPEKPKHFKTASISIVPNNSNSAKQVE